MNLNISEESEEEDSESLDTCKCSQEDKLNSNLEDLTKTTAKDKEINSTPPPITEEDSSDCSSPTKPAW